MSLCDAIWGDFFIFSPSESKLTLICRGKRDDKFLADVELKLYNLYTSSILHDIVTHTSDISFQNDRKLFCICQRPSFGPVIASDPQDCAGEWFHYPCVSITRAPKGKWYCTQCRSI